MTPSHHSETVILLRKHPDTDLDHWKVMIKGNCPFIDATKIISDLESAADVASVDAVFKERKISSTYFLHHCLMGHPM